MSSTKPEQLFAKHVIKQLSPTFIFTRHEDRVVSPGVPDLAYVARDGFHETGWLECKSVPAPTRISQRVKFRIEPAQHSWISEHHPLIPVHFLLQVGQAVFLVDGKHHKLLAEGLPFFELADHWWVSRSLNGMSLDGLDQQLLAVTRRTRNA